jgi:hypothetical protein
VKKKALAVLGRDTRCGNRSAGSPPKALAGSIKVVYVSGKHLIVKMEGQIRDIPNVPDSTRVMVDGKEVGIHDLQPGMHLQRTVTTTTTPRMITTVQSVRGKVWHVTPPPALS